MILAATSEDVEERRSAVQMLFESGLATPEDRTRLYEQLMDLNRETVLSPRHRNGRDLEHRIESGDSLDRISNEMRKQHGLALQPGLLILVNGMRSDMIHPNQVLKIPEQPRIVISKASRCMRLYVGECLIREYGVGIGRNDATPAGSFTIATRLVEPPWKNPETGRMVYVGEPEYAIGTRWLGFDDEFGNRTDLGIHGTNEPDSIGKAESLGCIRMRNAAVEELFDLVARGTRVEILEEAWPGA